MIDKSAQIDFWRRCRQRGLLPGPVESELQFMARVERAQEQRPILQSNLQNLFAVAPDWIPLSEQSSSLRPWEGAATIIESDQNGILSASIELGSSLLLSKEQILAHEAIHAIRCGFVDSLAEELLAWQTCSNCFLKAFSVLSLDLSQLLLAAAMLLFGFLGILLEELAGAIVAGLCLTLLLSRYWWHKRILHRAQNHLSSQGFSSLALLLHLSWDEIKALSCNPDHFWSQFSKKSHFRFEFLHATFGMLRDN